MKLSAGRRGLALLLALVLCLSLLPAPALAAVPISAGWSIREFPEDQFRVYKHAAADSAAAERYTDSVIDLSDALHFFLDGIGNSYSGFALLRLSGPEDARIPREGDTIADEGYYQLRCSTSSGSRYTYICPSGVFPDLNSGYADGTSQVNGGMALQYYAGKNALYYPAPGYYRFVYFHRQDRAVSYSGVYEITDSTGLYAGPGSMSASFSRSGGGAELTRLFTDGTYDLRLSDLTLPDGTAVSPSALTVKKIELLTDASSYIVSDGSSPDSIVSYVFNDPRVMYGPGFTASDSRALAAEDGALTLRGFTGTYLNEWGGDLNLASSGFDYVYRVKLTAEVNGAEREFLCTAPVAVAFHDPSWGGVVQMNYLANYPGGLASPADVRDEMEMGIYSALRPGNTFLAPEGFRFAGWNTAADGSGDAYLPGAAVRPLTDMTLYARWTRGSYIVKLPENMNPVVGSLWITGTYDGGRDYLWGMSYTEAADVSGRSYLAPDIPAGRRYTALELYTYVDGEPTVLARSTRILDDSFVGAVELEKTDAVYQIYDSTDGYPLQETRDYTPGYLHCGDGPLLLLPCLLSGEKSYSLQVSGVKTSPFYLDYDWTREWPAEAGWGSTLNLEPLRLERTRRISGRVSYLTEGLTKEDEPGVPGATVLLTQYAGGIPRSLTAVTDSDGRYVISAYPGDSEDYMLTVSEGVSPSYGCQYREDVGPDETDLRLGSSYVRLRAEVETDDETQTALAARALRTRENANLGISIFSTTRDIGAIGFGGRATMNQLSADFTVGLQSSTLPTEVTLAVSGALFDRAETGQIALTDGRGEGRVSLRLKSGVLLPFASELSSSFILDWYEGEQYVGSGSYLYASGSGVDRSAETVQYEDHYFAAPTRVLDALKEGGPKTYTLLLIPRGYCTHDPGTALSEVAESKIAARWDDVTLADGQITELAPAYISEAASRNLMYDTLPNSTLRADRESYSHEGELIRFTGSIGLDDDLTDGTLTRLELRPVRGNCVGFQALILNGRVYTPRTENINFETVSFVFDEPVPLPADYTLMTVSQRSDMDVEFTMTGDVRYSYMSNGETQHTARGNELIGTGFVARPGVKLSTPADHVNRDTISLTVTLASDFASTVIYDNGAAVAELGQLGSGQRTLQVQLRDTDEEYVTIHSLRAVSTPAEGGEPVTSDELIVTHRKDGPQLTKFTMDWDYIEYNDHLCINVGDHYSHWSAIGMDNVRFTAVFENSDQLDFLPGWEDENGDPVQAVFKVWTYDGEIRFLPAEKEYDTFTAMIPEHLPRAVTRAEVLYQPMPGSTGVRLGEEEDEVAVRWEADQNTRTQLTAALREFREQVDAYLADKTAEDSFALHWDGTEATLSGADPTEAGAEKTITEAWEDTVQKFAGYGIGLESYAVAYGSERTTLEWLRQVAAQQISDSRGRPGEYSRSVMLPEDGEFFALEKAAASAVADEHRITLVGDVTVDQFVLTDAAAEPGPETDLSEVECLYYVTLTFLADEANQTYLSIATANLGGAFDGFPAALQSEAAALMEGFEGHYSRYEDTKSSFGAAGGSSAVLGTNAATIDMLNDTSKALQMNKAVTNAGGAVLGVVDIWQGLEGWKNRTLDNHTMYRDIQRFLNSPCYQKLTEGQKQLVQHNFERFEKAYKATETTDMIVTGTNTAMTACSVAAACSGVAAPASLAITLGGVVVGWIGGAVNNAVRKEFVKSYEEVYTSISKIIRAHAYQADDDDCKGDDKPDGSGSSFSVCFDPSGIVYDGVIENPVQGATVSLYYAVDALGNPLKEGEEALAAGLRLAEDVEGLEPAGPIQITGPDGLYQWAVPEGLWFVTVEYAGRTATSRLDAAATVNAAGLTLKGEAAENLLPVLPPQLDVNIPVTDETSPTVESLEWTDDGLLLRFSKYMAEADVLDPASYTVKNSAGEAVAVTSVESTEQGRVPANIDPAEPSCSRAVLLKAVMPEDGALELSVSGSVRSCAGTAMGRDWTGYAFSAVFGVLGDAGELSWSCLPEKGVLSVSGPGLRDSAPVWAAAYDTQGRMTALYRITAAGSVEFGPEAPDIRLFWTDGQGRPKCEAVRVR